MHLTTTIDTLSPDTVYYFKMQARNDKGYGPQSDVVQYRTPDVRERTLSQEKSQKRLVFCSAVTERWWQ